MTALEHLARTDAIARLVRRDPTLCSVIAEERERIKSRLGWVGLATKTAANVPFGVLAQATSLAEQAATEGVTDVVLLGMGGSSLAALAISAVVGADSTDGWRNTGDDNGGGGNTGDNTRDNGGTDDSMRRPHPRMHVLDTVAPTTVTQVLAKTMAANTLHLVASKSGSTVEPNALYSIFRERAVKELGSDRAGQQFVALTDKGSPLEALAHKDDFYKVILTPADVGGRFAALTAFGLVPAALAGADIARLTQRAAAAEALCSQPEPIADNPAAALAAFMLDAYASAADKLTIITPHGLTAIGLWIEQLVAESLGKSGIGIVPVFEIADQPRLHGPDRAIVAVRLAGGAVADSAGATPAAADDPAPAAADSAATPTAPAAAEDTRIPKLEIILRDPYDIAAEFVRWEYAVALAGSVLGVNPFDEPSVAAAKDAASAILDGSAAPPTPQPTGSSGWPAVSITPLGGLQLEPQSSRSLTPALSCMLATLRPGDYLSLLAFLPNDPDLLAPLGEAARAAADATGHAVCFGLGPRYLHSTGQLHKGGPPTGAFVLVTAQDTMDLPVPGKPWSLQDLHRSQAEGDLIALAKLDRRVLWVDLANTSDASIRALAQALSDAAKKMPLS
ncbi:MAG: hypothetical protein FWE94_01455 [Coriobacteriia bacterium]|nr:hypothetical protein [Coriobacteriia bacterium]